MTGPTLYLTTVSRDAPKQPGILPGRQANLRRGDGGSKPESKRVDMGRDDVERFVWKGEMRIQYLKLGNVLFFNPEMHIIYFNVWMNRCLTFESFLVRSSNVAKYM